MRSLSGGRARDFNGLPGVTSHHTCESRSRFIAVRAIMACAACGGSNVPPIKPMRWPGTLNGNRALKGAPFEVRRIGGGMDTSAH